MTKQIGFRLDRRLWVQLEIMQPLAIVWIFLPMLSICRWSLDQTQGKTSHYVWKLLP